MRKFALVAAAQMALAISCVSPSLAQEAPDAAAEDTTELLDLDFSRADLDAITRIPQPGNAVRINTPSDSTASWNHSENKNGSANVALKRSWASGVVSQLGVDSVGSQPAAWPQPGTAPAPASGTAWANALIPGMGLLDQTTLDARLDPDGDQRKFGARFQKSFAVHPELSVTLQNAYGVSQSFAPQTITGVAPPAQVFDSEQLAKLNVLNFGTSVFAGTKQSSSDERKLHSFGAEQSLLGGVSVSGAVSENTTGGHDRSLTARFKRSW